MKLTGQKVLLTGGSSGIGLELARLLSRKSNELFICGRDQAALTRTAQELPGIETLAVDLAREDDLQRLIATVEDRFGELSLLFNNAAIQLNYDFTQVKESSQALHDIDYEIAVNLSALIKLSLLSLPLLQRATSATLINVTSGLGIVPKKRAPVYCATKAGVDVFSKAFRYQLEDAKLPIQVCEVILPLVETPMTTGRGTHKMQPQAVAEAIVQGIERKQDEIHVGPVPLLLWLNRLSPRRSAQLLRNS